LKAVLPILELSIYSNLDSEMNELIQKKCVSLCFGLNAFVYGTPRTYV